MIKTVRKGDPHAGIPGRAGRGTVKRFRSIMYSGKDYRNNEPFAQSI